MQLHRIVTSLLLTVPLTVVAQPPRGAPPPPQTAREAAPVDLTGYWVSVVSEDWRWRMVTPVRGDFASIPLNEQGQRIGMEWNPDADDAAGLECKAYGAAAIMRMPGRVHIEWADDNTLRLETDAGMQTRLFHFDAPAMTDEPRSRQGYSVANWEKADRGIGPTDSFGLFSGSIGSAGRSLEVKTTNLLAGYYRKNGPPYSEDAVLQEYYDYHVEPNGSEWFTVTTVVTDPTYLRGAFITSSDFKKEEGDGGWNPTACSVK